MMRSSPDVRAFSLDGKLILVRDDDHPMIILNETARIVWEEIERGSEFDDIVARLVASFTAPRERVNADVLTIVNSWCSQGLLIDASCCGPQLCLPRTSEKARPINHRRPLQTARVYSLCGTGICLRFEQPEIERAIHPVFAHAETPFKRTEHVLDLVMDGSDHVIALNGFEVARSSSIEEMIGLIINHILDLSYPDVEWLAMIHAAVVGSERSGAIVMPAASGSGKSTLTAALIHEGFMYLSDEVAPLDRRTKRIRPVPYAVTVKRGSWEVLNHHYPELCSLPVYSDGSQAQRYLAPPQRARAPSAGLPARCLLFPSFQPDRPRRFHHLSDIEALQKLVEARCWISLDSQNFAEMLRWLQQIPKYAANYPTLDEGVSLVKEVMSRAD